MCGILFYLTRSTSLYASAEESVMKEFKKIRYRGPDNTVLEHDDNNKQIWGFHRLAIQDTSGNGDQPIKIDDKKVICNGEIYNFKDLQSQYRIKTNSGSDTEVLLRLYSLLGIEKTLEEMSGVFAFVIKDGNRIIVARDPIGVRPLFYFSNGREYCFSSEAKVLIGMFGSAEIFPPGMYWEFDCSNPTTLQISPVKKVQYYKYNYPRRGIEYYDACENVKALLIESVRKRLISDRPVGLLISGGLDSSIVAGIACRLHGDPANIHSFSIGLPGSIDVQYAQKVADYLGTHHHVVPFTVEEGLSAIEDVIYYLETYDITTIRASIPNYLLAKYVRFNTDVKVVISGEGSDEIFGGYLYFHRSPNDNEFQKETERLVRELHRFDVLRCDRTTASNGLEVREPFLDKDLVKFVMSMPAEYKRPDKSAGKMEKYILRKAFDGLNYIPDEVLWRTKDAFSDACGYDWVPSLKSYIELQVSDTEYETMKGSFNGGPEIVSKEAYYYRKVFNKLFGNNAHLLDHYWMPNWCGISNEPSATYLSEHELKREQQ